MPFALNLSQNIPKKGIISAFCYFYSFGAAFVNEVDAATTSQPDMAWHFPLKKPSFPP
jgi:hypothetical protein